VRYRPLGGTGIEVSEIGYGAWGIGGSQWGGADDDESIRALHRAIDLGVNFIDTALAYGGGRSERLVGQVVRERSEKIHVATKVPPKNLIWPAQAGWPVEEVFPADHIRACAQRSLSNLGLERIDLLQLHVWSDEWTDEGDWRDAVEELLSSGAIGCFGISINDHEPDNALRVIETGAVDTVQVIYNVFDQSPEDELLPACLEHDVGVLARVPLDEGALTGRIGPDSEFPEGDFRNDYFRDGRLREVDEHVRAILEDLSLERDALAETALRYILSHDAVSTVIPGMRSVRNVERNAALGDGRGLPDAQVQALKRHRWVRDFYR
jgi:aryl-alcohol dehydrogenase-like predicted oxidoreductase